MGVWVSGISISSVQKSWVSLGIPLGKRVSNDSAGSDGKGCSGIFLCVKSCSGNKSRNLMDSSLKISIVSSDSLVSTDSNWDGEVGGSYFSLELKGLDSIGESWGNSSSIWISSINSSIGETSISSIQESWVSLSLSLAIIVKSRYNSTSARAEAHISTGLLFGNGKGRDKAGNLMNRSSKVSIGASNSLISSNSNWYRVTGDNSRSCIWITIDTSVWVASIQQGGVCLGGRGSLAGNCQQYTGKDLHCSSVARKLTAYYNIPPAFIAGEAW